MTIFNCLLSDIELLLDVVLDVLLNVVLVV